MATKDNAYRFNHVVQLLAPAARTATATSSALDTAQYESVCVVFTFGAWTDGSFTPSISDCATSGGSFTTVSQPSPTYDTQSGVYVPTLDVSEGALTAVTSSTGQNAVQKVGYLGPNRYLKAVFTVSGATTGMFCEAIAILSNSLTAPV